MMRKFLIAVSIITALSYTVLSFSAYAQTIPNITIPDVTANSGSISLSVNSQHPHPNQSVTVTVTSYSTDLARAFITWIVNGKTVQKSTGSTTFDITLGAAGSVTNITVNVSGADGTSYSSSVTLTPANVDLLWQANSYTPLFYKGKALFPYQGSATIVALPDFGPNTLKIGSKNFIYIWKKNDQVQTDQSGYGKDTFTVASQYLSDPINIEADVSNADGSIVGSNTITITPESPQVVIYQYSPLYGTLLNQSIQSNFNLVYPEITLLAIPYFFNTTNRHSITPLAFNWHINGTDAGTKTTNDLTLRQPGNIKGQSVITASAKNPQSILQFANHSVTINFSPLNTQ